MVVTISYQQTTKVKEVPTSTRNITNQQIEIPESEDPDEILFHVTDYLQKLSMEEDTEFHNIHVDGIPNKAILFLKPKKHGI